MQLGRRLTKNEIADLVDDADKTTDVLRSNDMVVFDNNDEPIDAYPFTMEQRDHKVRVNGFMVHSMCTLDALAISPMFEMQTYIESVCAVTGDLVIVDQLNQEVLNNTENSEVYFGLDWSSAKDNCCATSLCTEMIFLKGKNIAEAWAAERAGSREIFTLQEAIEFSTRFFKPLIDYAS